METHASLAAFIGDLSRPGKVPGKKDGLALGKTFTGSKEIMKIISVLSGKYSNGKSVGASDIDFKEPVSAFYAFVLMYRQYFNDYSKRDTRIFEQKINVVASALSISKADRDLVAEFFTNQEPYTDKNKAVYFNNDKKAVCAKYIGTNIIYAAGRSNEIVYLKYFETYNLFLSKIFIKSKNPYHFLENIIIGEMDIVNSSNYFMDDYGYNTYSEIIESIKNHKPFQYFELEATANTPKILLDPEQGRVVISGSSSPFSPTNFFTPVLEWFEHYRVSGKDHLQVFIMLDYFNTYTSKFLLYLIRKCDTMTKEKKHVKIYWYFDPEDSDMREFGEHLNGICKSAFEYCLITDGEAELV